MRKVLTISSISILCLAFSFINPKEFKILIENRLNDYISKDYPEKIYMQTDKPYYTAGEDLWFNAYLLNGISHKISTKSNIIYVELIDEENNIISERKLFAETVSIHGDFKLPRDLKDGTYLLRAYTNYMRNQDEAFFFKKEIRIYSLFADATEEYQDSSLDKDKFVLPEIGFYPEGGYMVSGLSNKIAVKIKDADVYSKKVEGRIEDGDGNKITDLSTYEFGLGSFYLIPELGKEYRAVINAGDEDIIYELPKPLQQGYVMNTSILEKEVIINISTNKVEKLKNLLIIGHQRGIPAFDYIHEKDESSMTLKIPKKDFIEGVLNIVLFDATKNPVAERMLYIKKESEISISVKKTNGTKIMVRDKVNLEIAVKNNLGRLVPSTFSLSVTDATLIKTDPNQENIMTYLLLNSDLRGKIKTPNYFFTQGDSIKKSQQLDLIMLTHGWRRFTWQDILEKRKNNPFKAEEALYISGKTLHSKSPFQNKVSETKMTFRTNGFYQQEQKTDNQGRFSYGPFVFHDTLDVFLQAGNAISSDKPDFTDTKIVIDKPKSRPSIIPEGIFNPYNFEKQEGNFETYKNQSRNYVFKNFDMDPDRESLDEVLIKGKLKSKEEILDEKRNKRTRSFSPSHRVVVDEKSFHGGGTFMELILNVPGIRVGRKQGYQNETSQDFEVNLRGMKPAFYLDNTKVTLEIAMSVPQSNIDFIDILNTGSSSSQYGLEAQGVIAIYSKQGGTDNIRITESKPGAINFKADGFYTAREFYSPDYTLVDRNTSKEDKRSTVFWKTNVINRGYKAAEVTFYTGDEKGLMHVNIEGITDTGIPIHSTVSLNIE